MNDQTQNRLRKVHELGQSLWLDDIRRSWLRDGHLARLISEDALAGVTSNPAIFAKAISEGAGVQRRHHRPGPRRQKHQRHLRDAGAG